MSSSLYTEKEIKQMIKDAVALKDQKEAHDEAIQKLVDYASTIHCTQAA